MRRRVAGWRILTVMGAAALGGWGCVGDAAGPGGDSGADASPARDAGAEGDASSEDGALSAPDAGAGRDAAQAADASAGPDASAADAGRADATEAPDASGADAGSTDASGSQDAGPFDAGIPTFPGAPVVYTGDRTQSPINEDLARHLRDIAAKGSGLRSGVFMKVGDSISTSSSGVSGGYFLNCFDGKIGGTVSWEFNVDLAGRTALIPTIEFYRATRIGSDDSFARESLSTRVGQDARWALSGSPSPMESEYAAAQPQVAVVMFGSNDIGWYGGGAYPVADQAEGYEAAMRGIADWLIARGVIPVLTTMPPRVGYEPYVPVYTGVVRAIAQGRQVPLVDYNRELMALPEPHGLGDDGIHPTCADYNTCCWFDSANLTHGYNVRNLITLEALDRLKRVLVDREAAPDPAPATLAGDGSAAAPFLIPSLPFGEVRDTRRSTSRTLDGLGCSGAPATPGPEYFYELVLPQRTALRILLLDGGARALRLALLSAPDAKSCLESEARMIAGAFPAGTYFIAVDTPAGSDGAEYTLSVTPCIDGDPSCP